MMVTLAFLIGYLSGVSAQTYALGGLYNPSSLKSDAVFINPSMIPNSKFSGVLGIRQSYFASELTDIHFSASTKINKLGLALGILKTGIKDVYSDYTFLMGVGFKKSNCGVGINSRIKYLKNIEDDLASSSLSLDYGLFAKVGIFNFSLMHLNFLRTSVGFYDRSEKSLDELLFFTSFNIPEPVTWVLGIDKTPEKMTYRFGTELWFTEGFGLRVAVLEREIRLGLGLKTDTYGVDISFGSSRELGTTYLISTSYTIR
ncbi:MAG: hypothetical protein QMD82_03800 [bacterium]|nr:hypothetical protein [bacterium]